MDYFTEVLQEQQRNTLPHTAVRARQCLDVYRRYAGGVPARFLDIGCSTGELVGYFQREHGVPSVGIDTSREALTIARRTAGDLFVEGDICGSPLPPGLGKFDLIVSFELFQFFGPEDFKKGVDVVAGMLSPGGVFLLMVPNCGHPFLSPYLSYSDPYNRMRYTPESLYRALKGAPLRLERILRWNSASARYRVVVRDLLQRALGPLLTRTLSVVFQMPGKLSDDVFTDDLYLSSHIAAVLRKG